MNTDDKLYGVGMHKQGRSFINTDYAPHSPINGTMHQEWTDRQSTNPTHLPYPTLPIYPALTGARRARCPQEAPLGHGGAAGEGQSAFQASRSWYACVCLSWGGGGLLGGGRGMWADLI